MMKARHAPRPPLSPFGFANHIHRISRDSNAEEEEEEEEEEEAKRGAPPLQATAPTRTRALSVLSLARSQSCGTVCVGPCSIALSHASVTTLRPGAIAMAHMRPAWRCASASARRFVFTTHCDVHFCRCSGIAGMLMLAASPGGFVQMFAARGCTGRTRPKTKPDPMC